MSKVTNNENGSKWLLPSIIGVLLIACIGLGISLYSIHSGGDSKKGTKSFRNELSFEGHEIDGDIHVLGDFFKTGNVTVFSEGNTYVNLDNYSYLGYDDCSLSVRGTPRSYTAYTIQVSLPYTKDLSILKERFFWVREQFLKKYNATSSSDYVDINMDVLASVSSINDLSWKQLGIGQAGQTPETKITNIENGEIRIITWCNQGDRATVCIFFNNLKNTELREQEIQKNKEEGKGDWIDNL